MVDETLRPVGALIERLWEVAGLAEYRLPGLLRRLYGGGIGFADSCVYSNLIATLDGVTALDSPGTRPGSDLAGGDPADRFVMGLLRACADAILVGAGTVRAHRSHQWVPARVAPAYASAWTQLRTDLGRSREPRLVVVTRSGDLDPQHPALAEGGLVLTTDGGADRLNGRLPAACRVTSLGARAPMREVVAAIRAEGHRLILTEGGPHVLGEMVAAGLLDELFLTISPAVVGRSPGDRRLGLLEGNHVPSEISNRATLLSVRRSASHLFLRYSLDPAGLPARD